jgi:hypothetical protein
MNLSGGKDTLMPNSQGDSPKNLRNSEFSFAGGGNGGGGTDRSK